MADRKKLLFRTFLVIFFCICFALALFIYANSLNNRLNSQIKTILEEVSSQSVLLVQKEVENQFNVLGELAQRMEKVEKNNIEEYVQMITPAKEKYGFRNLGILYDDYILYTSSGSVVDVKDVMEKNQEKAELNGNRKIVKQAFLEKVFNGERVITDPIIDLDTDEEIILYGIPIFEENSEKVSAVLFATYKSDALRKVVEVSSFNGQGYSYIVKSNGDMVIKSSNKLSFKDPHNVFTSMAEVDSRNEKSIKDLKNLIENGKSGHLTFYNEMLKYMDCTPLEINDWYILNVIPASVMNKVSVSIMNNTYLLCFALIALVGIFVIYIILNEKRKNTMLTNILYTDKLTGGYSFQKFTIMAEKLLSQYSDFKYAIVVMDIDKFKLINELLGYNVGDEALKRIWTLLNANINEKEIFARRESDKFIMLLNYKDEEDIIERINDLAEILQNDKNNGGYVLKPAFGIYPVDKNRMVSIKKMYNYALIALSTIKGKDVSYAFFNDELSEKMKENKIMEDNIVKAYKNEEFVVFYQPKYDAITKKMVGAEALIRWKKPNGSIIPPFKFIPIAENNGFIVKLDKYMFKKVCEQQKAWLDEGLPVVPVSVNLSRTHLYNSAFVGEYKKILDEVGLPIEYVQLEITESAMFDNQTQFLDIVDRLHSFGFMILMDDFGTGYSSLMMLKSIPIDILKLDKSFVDDYNDIKGEKIITYITQLAKSINISVTAEGVETEEQYSFLKNLGCDLIQGYYFAKPMPKEDFENELKKVC